MSDGLVFLAGLVVGTIGASLGSWFFMRPLRARLAVRQADLEVMRKALAIAQSKARAPGQTRRQAVPESAPDPRDPSSAKSAEAIRSSPSAQRQAAPMLGASRPAAPPHSTPSPDLARLPLRRPDPVSEPEVVEPELTDEEIDALPPELPVNTTPRKRILPAPRKPTMNRL